LYNDPGVHEKRRAELEGVLQRLLLYPDIFCKQQMERQLEQMSGEGAKGVVENGETAAHSLSKPFDRMHAARPKRLAAATLLFPGKLACNGFPYTLIALIRGFGICNGFHLFPR
jgi:hypothetical protein